MGVTQLWPILQPCARPTKLETLNRKRLAVDASIWIYQFLKAVRDKEGNALRNSHIVGFFRRICKLLYFGIKPVFVFDGGAPALKRQTILSRKRRREGRRDDAARTAGKLLAMQMQRRAEESEDKRKREIEVRGRPADPEEEEELPGGEDLVYTDELGMSHQERQQSRKFVKKDAYHLPDINGDTINMGQPNDPRIMSVEELEDFAKQHNSGENIDVYDFSKIDFNGEFFRSLPAVDRYNILNAARLRSRLRMGLSKEQLEEMFPDRMAFSKFQIERVRERNELTQRLMNLNGMNVEDAMFGVGSSRIAGERGREYILVKNEGVEGGWALGVVSKDKEQGERNRPIDIDALHERTKTKQEDEEAEDEDEFEDVPVEGLNRLPKMGTLFEEQQQYVQTPHDQEDDWTRKIQASTTNDSLFVEQNPTAELFEEGAPSDGEEELNRAIAMSLEKNFNISELENGEDDFEDVTMLTYDQKVSENPRLLSKGGREYLTDNVNNRASAVVPKYGITSESSDEDENLQDILAAARRKKTISSTTTTRKHPLALDDINTSFDGPLPFERLDLGKSIFNTNPQEPANEDQHSEGLDENLAGGFELNSKEGVRPLPPWLASTGDIRSDVKAQQASDHHMNAGDYERRLEEERVYQRNHDVIEVESSDEDRDFEVLEATEPKKSQEAIEFTGHSKGTPADNIGGGDSAEPNESAQLIHENSSRSPSKDEPPLSGRTVSPLPTFENIEMSESMATALPQISQERDGTTAMQDDDAFDRQLADVISDADFDEFDDPEDEELLVQLSLEVEEHARFASSLNNNTAQNNRDEYDQELRQLKNQQKKDRRDADEVSHIMITECQALLRLFGLPYITAPMEAEAQCAELVNLGLVDGIVTDDSDIFLFGGTRVYKNMFNNNKFVECYLTSDLEKELSLSRDKLIEFAHLLGSDYTEGLPGIGPVTALEIISEFPSTDGLQEFKDWWIDVQHNNRPKEADAKSPFRKKFRRAQAKKLFLPPSFPSHPVTEAYLEPDVDSTPEPFQWGVPDLDNLRSFLMATVGWTQERTDEVLVPVIKDMNRREAEGTQSNITRYFEGAVGVGARGNSSGAGGNKGTKSLRMKEAMKKLKTRTAGNLLNTTFADEATAWAKKNELSEAAHQAKQKNAQKAKKRTLGNDDTVADDEAAEDITPETVDPSAQAKEKGKRKKSKLTT